MVNAVKGLLSNADPGAKVAGKLGISSSNSLLNALDPASKIQANAQAGKPLTGATALDPGGYILPSAKQSLNPSVPAPIPPGPPNQDTAANALLQQQDYLRRRRGVFANIFAGSGNSSPVVANRSQLGG